MYCQKCGNEIESGSDFCTECGAKIEGAGPGGRPDAAVFSPTPAGSGSDSVPQVRPWVRFFARLFDFFLAYLLVIFLAFFVFSLIPGGSDIVNSIIETPAMDLIVTTMSSYLLLALIEPFFIANFGQTPGKWLLKTKVLNAGGGLLTFSQALTRSFSVYTRGYLLGIPLIYFITLFIEDSRLEKEGKTSWDRDGGFVVHHETIGPLRVIAAIIFFVITRIVQMWSMSP